MKFTHKPDKKLNLLTAALLGTFAIGANAQEAAEEDSGPRNALEEIVVTGTTGKGITVLESSVAVTALSSEDLEKDVPYGLVDTLKGVPGFFVQESGGQTSNSVGVRGLPSTAQLAFISVHEDGLPVNYERYTVDAVQRYSMGIDRVEAIRGGSSAILSPNGAGGTINYIYKKGTQDAEGSLKLAYTDYDNVRTDFFYGGPLSEDWTLAMSGYYQYGDTARETGFNGERGGEFRFNLTRELENGELNLTYKKIDESNSFILPLPVQRNPSSNTLSEIPGFDIERGNVNSFNNSRVNILFADGSSLEQNTVDGADVDADVLTLSLDWDFGNGWFLNHSSRVSDMSRTFSAHFTGSAGGDSILPANSYFTNDRDWGGYGTVNDFFAANPGTSRCYQYVSDGRRICQGDPALNSLNGNGLVQVLNSLREPIQRKQFISDTRFSFETDRNSLTFGAMLFDLSHDRKLASSLFLSEVTSNEADMLDIVAVDSAGNAQAYYTDGGVIRHGQWRGDDDVQVKSVNLYVNDEYQVNDSLRIDAGIRFESSEYQAASLDGLGDRFTVAGALDINGNDVDNILANNVANRLAGSGGVSRRTVDYDEVSWTLGFNYLLSDTLATYGRYAEGYQLPRADRLGDLTLNTPNGVIDTPANEVRLYELGLRYSGDTWGGSATLYRTEFPDLLTGGFGFDAGGTQVINIAELDVTGVELDLFWNPSDNFGLTLAGVIQSGELDNFNTPAGSAFNGNNVARTPDEQFRLAGTYYASDSFSVFADYHWLGERFGANDNIVRFESCGQLGLGAIYNISEAISLQIKGKNLNDAVCYTEGNPRATVAENQLQLGYARPVVGRNWVFSAQWNF